MEKVLKIYESPVVETMKCRVEQGFAGSAGNGLGTTETAGDKTIENRRDGGNWGGDGIKFN